MVATWVQIPAGALLPFTTSLTESPFFELSPGSSDNVIRWIHLPFCYDRMEDQVEDEGQLTVYDLLSFQALLRDSTLAEADSPAGLQWVAQLETRGEYADFSEVLRG